MASTYQINIEVFVDGNEDMDDYGSVLDYIKQELNDGTFIRTFQDTGTVDIGKVDSLSGGQSRGLDSLYDLT